MSKFDIKNDPFKYFRLLRENILYPGKFKFDFAVIGAQKAGTSALDKYLRDHPKLAMPKWKEISYFNNDVAFEKNALPNPRAFYKVKNRMKIHGEVTPCYIYSPMAVKRIKVHNPRMKIIAILRNPVERAFSQYNMEVWRNWEQRSFFECITEEIEEIRAGTKEHHMVKSYVHRGLYAEQIKKVYKEFPEEQVFFLKYEDFRENQVENLNRIYSFLGVSAVDIPRKKTANKVAYKCGIAKNERKILTEFFMPTITEVEKLLSWDCSDWKD